MQESSKRAIVAAFIANLGIAFAKFIGFVVTGSASLLAEAVHSVADTSNQGLLMLGGRRARRPATERHAFGYSRERYFWSFIVAMLLFSLGSLFALVEGIEKLLKPHSPGSVRWALGILLISFCFEAMSLRTALQETRHANTEDHSLWRFIRYSKIPELPVVLLEDLGALVGLAFAIIGILLTEITGNARFDATGSVAIGLLLGVIAITLAIKMKSLLIGESASTDIVATITERLEAEPRVRRLIHMRTQHLGPEELLVGAKLELDRDLDFDGVAATLNSAEQLVRSAVPEARIIYLEPDIYHPEVGS